MPGVQCLYNTGRRKALVYQRRPGVDCPATSRKPDHGGRDQLPTTCPATSISLRIRLGRRTASTTKPPTAAAGADYAEDQSLCWSPDAARQGGPEATSKTISMAHLEASFATIAERLRLPEVGRLYAQASKLKRNVTTSLGQSCLTADLETSHGVSCEIRAVTHGSPIVFSKTGWCLMR